MCALGYAAVVLGTYWRLWWPDAEPTMLGGDVSTSYWQDVAFAVQSIRHGEIPLWNRFERGGYPFVCDPQAAYWSPFSWLVWTLGVISGSAGPWLQELRQLGACVLAATGMHMFLRAHRASAPAAAMAGSVMAIGAVPVRTIMMATYWPSAWVGFVLWGIEAVVRDPGPRSTRGLVLALLLLGTSGFPPSIFYALLVVVPYALVRLAQVRRLRVLGCLALAGALASLGLLVVVLPALEQTELSARARRGLAYVLSDPGKLEYIGTLLSPGEHGKSIFVGLAALCSALCSVLALRRTPERGIVLVLVAVGATGFVLSAGAQTPALGWLAQHVPGFDLFRIAKRYVVLTHTSLAILAGLGLQEVLGRLERKWPAPRRWSTGLGAGLVLANVLDLQRYAPPGMWDVPPDRAALADLLDRVDDQRIYNEWGLGARPGSLYRVRDWRGRGEDPMAFARYLQAERRVTEAPELLTHFGVRYVLTGMRNRYPVRPRVRHPARIARRVEPQVWMVDDPAPEIYWTDRIQRVRRGRALAAMSAVDPGTHAFVETPAIEPREGSGPSVPGTVTLRGGDRYAARVEAPREGVVVMNEVWHPGWRAWVDGTPTPLHRVNHLVRGVVVGPGPHVIELRFMPSSLPLAAPLYFVVLFGSLTPWERIGRRRRSRHS